jgi:uncharacterized membrane protein
MAIAVLAALGVRFFVSNAFRYTDITEHTYGVLWPYRGWLALHVIGGSLALVLGPLQFLSNLRRKAVQVHRWLGRLYLGGVAIGSCGAFYLGSVARHRAFGWSLMAMAFAWLSTASFAYIAIRRRQFAAHREWVIRNYVVTYGFVTFRLAFDLGILKSLERDAATVDAWFCWVIPLFITEMILQWRHTVGPRSRRLNA